MILFLDSSFCASLYFTEAGSSLAVRTVANWQGQICISALAELEVANACRLRAFRKQCSQEEASALWAQFERDLSQEVIVAEPLTSVVLVRAKQLALDHASETGTRTLDIIHVAAAVAAGADQFASFDAKQRALAKLVGLKVTPRSLP